MKRYNYNETLAMLNEVADEVGRGTLYEDIRDRDMPACRGGVQCYNVHALDDGTVVPGCIVGQVVVNKIGVSARDIHESGQTGSDAHELALWVRSRGIAGFFSDAINLLVKVQILQDDGFAWGDAIDKAHEQMKS